MTFRILVLTTLAATSLHAAPPRAWKNEDGSRSIQGTFVSRDANSVTIRLSSNFENRTIPLGKLHPEDRAWLDKNQPLAGKNNKNNKEPAMPDSSEIFDNLAFGDSRAVVLSKLKSSKFVVMAMDETFIGRTGLNGVFHTKNQIGGLEVSLYFDWTANDKLKEISLQTDHCPASEFKTKILPCWKEFAELLTTLHGKPVQADSNLRLEAVPDGAMLPTHLWKLETKGSAMLGTARDGDKYQIVVRFTENNVRPVEIP